MRLPLPTTKSTEQEDALKKKIALDYEMGEVSYLDVLLNSSGILDFLSNYYLISEIMQKDNDLLDEIEEKKNKIEKDKKDLESKQKKVKTQKAEQERMNVLLSNQKVQKQNKISSSSGIKKIGKRRRETEETGRELSGNKVERNAGAEDSSEDISEFEKGIWKSI